MVLWPTINAGLVAVVMMLVIRGVYLVKVKRDLTRHIRTMHLALAVFVVFLVSFALKAMVVGFQPLPTWDHPVQPRMILIVHEVMAVVTIIVLAITYHAGFTKRWARHRRFAPWAAGLWIFQGLFGLWEYYILYHL